MVKVPIFEKTPKTLHNEMFLSITGRKDSKRRAKKSDCRPNKFYFVRNCQFDHTVTPDVITVTPDAIATVTPDAIGRLLLTAEKRLPVRAGNDEKRDGNDTEGGGGGNDGEVCR